MPPTATALLSDAAPPEVDPPRKWRVTGEIPIGTVLGAVGAVVVATVGNTWIFGRFAERTENRIAQLESSYGRQTQWADKADITRNEVNAKLAEITTRLGIMESNGGRTRDKLDAILERLPRQ